MVAVKATSLTPTRNLLHTEHSPEFPPSRTGFNSTIVRIPNVMQSFLPRKCCKSRCQMQFALDRCAHALKAIDQLLAFGPAHST